MLSEKLLTWTDEVDTMLVRYFSDKDMICNPLDRAMEYTLLAGGKRLRPLLTLAVNGALGGDAATALPFSLASELLHTYSLIHDDLPCMDNDDMRRGKPTNHVIFGEANAVLAGDALQAEAFRVLAATPHPTLSAERRVAALIDFADAVGRRGMVAGQVMDLASEGKDIDLERLTALHQRKTGALLCFCVRLGGHLCAADEARMQLLTRFAHDLGLMFQVVDDLLDLEASSQKLGKTAGKDAAAGKATFPRLLGLDDARAFADRLLEQALATLAQLEAPTEDLVEITRFARHREH